MKNLKTNLLAKINKRKKYPKKMADNIDPNISEKPQDPIEFELDKRDNQAPAPPVDQAPEPDPAPPVDPAPSVTEPDPAPPVDPAPATPEPEPAPAPPEPEPAPAPPEPEPEPAPGDPNGPALDPEVIPGPKRVPVQDKGTDWGFIIMITCIICAIISIIAYVSKQSDND